MTEKKREGDEVGCAVPCLPKLKRREEAREEQTVNHDFCIAGV